MQTDNNFIDLSDRRKEFSEKIAKNKTKLNELTKELQELSDLWDDIKEKRKHMLIVDIVYLVLPPNLADIPFDIERGRKKVRLKELLAEVEKKMSSIIEEKKKVREANEKLKLELASVEEELKK